MSSELGPSASLRRAAGAERERIDRVRGKLVQRRERLRDELARIEAELGLLDERTQLLDRVAGADPGPAAAGGGPRVVAAAQQGALGGRELRETAARILLATFGVGREIHYRDWLDRVLAAGHDIAGRDPGASFLTNVSRSPVIARGEAPGTYRIDLDRIEALRAELAEKQAELSDLVGVIAREREPAAGARLRQHRTKLLAEIRRLENQVGEADRVLAAEADAAGPAVELPRVAA